MFTKILIGVLTLSILLVFSTSQASGEGNPNVVIKTTKGDMVLELFMDKAPITVKNFLSYVDDKFYDGTIFHRVIKDFMIQGGGHLQDMSKKPTKGPIQNEAANGLSNVRGSIAMARMPDPHSATAQFFINHANNTGLDHRDKTEQGYGYCVFGKVVEGMDIVDAIANCKTMTKGGHRDVPRETITIISIRTIE
ncbi:MAG: peptidylprolyl isomerase [Candidatus Aminicenantes bacterium]|nr:peptidylprolyl isomerase [Candidatus Aminicenantes bacterium]